MRLLLWSFFMLKATIIKHRLARAIRNDFPLGTKLGGAVQHKKIILLSCYLVKLSPFCIRITSAMFSILLLPSV